MGKDIKKTIKISLDEKIYSAEALKLASYIFLPKAAVSFKENREKISLEIKNANDEIAGDFLNEALNQQCRIDLAKKNSEVSKIIVTKALLSALGNRS